MGEYVARSYTTAGEDFVAFLVGRHIGDYEWERLATALVSTGRGDDWSAAIQDMAVLHLARRLIAGGASIVASSADWDLVVEREIKQMVVDTMVVDYFRVGEIYARLELAVEAARSKISPGTRSQLRSECQREAPWCYLCGADLDFGAKNSALEFTLDHVWPQAFGGNSDPENLLPACRSCNERKGHAASWSLYPVQALVHGYRLSSDDLAAMPKEMRFAVHSRIAMQEASLSGSSLKEAFVRLGRPDLPTVVDESASVDVFNLAATFR
ncbi:hypothetical protein CFI00_10175 [Nocardioides sp. S5]|nr:hypothetical protein CFI00_10175 [Nocardioides sp. S5]